MVSPSLDVDGSQVQASLVASFGVLVNILIALRKAKFTNYLLFEKSPP